ncbi:MAG: hypothetical protein KDA28_09005 [Phycisphaerales bacterium]|nr:hypothetical protein [Phycisphaerales bacterium]
MKGLGWMGWIGSAVVLSGIFGILALIAFKYISFQGGIKSVKDKIKGAMIEIRLYQDDLGIVSKAVFKVLGRNFQYLGLNFGPILPLLVPFVFVAGQLVVRFAFVPLSVWTDARGEWMPGKGTTVTLVMAKGDEKRVADVEVDLPKTLEIKSPIVRNTRQGKLFFEVVPVAAGDEVMHFRMPGGVDVEKRIVTGDLGQVPVGDVLQGLRSTAFADKLQYPGESSPSGSPIAKVEFAYPERDVPGPVDGVMGILLLFLVASMAFGFALLKPLKIQI